jgi:hypothetical protein
LQIEAQRKAVRTLAYHARLTLYMVYENQIDKMGSPKFAILPSPQALTEKAWQNLLKYVDDGGNLLITGPVERDEHWQMVNRASQVSLMTQGARAVPLTYHNADSTPPDASLGRRSFELSFDLQAQSWLESLRIHSPIAEISRGKGNIFWTSDPIELAQGDEPLAKIYSYVLARANGWAHADIQPLFELQSHLSAGIFVYPILLTDSILYVLVSDDAQDEEIKLLDKTTGVPIAFRLPAEHAAMALIGQKEKAVIAKYGF